MSHSSVIGMHTWCKHCSHRFELGELNARRVDQPVGERMEPFEMGWLCKCDHCGTEARYVRADFATD
jgi:hypothetical protein